MSNRLPLRTGSPWEEAVPDIKVYQRTLQAIKTRRGLLHGAFNQGGRVCAVGALERAAQTQGGLVCDRETLLDIQAINDSVPNATAAERRKVVMQWLREKIAKGGVV